MAIFLGLKQICLIWSAHISASILLLLKIPIKYPLEAYQKVMTTKDRENNNSSVHTL